MNYEKLSTYLGVPSCPFLVHEIGNDADENVYLILYLRHNDCDYHCCYFCVIHHLCIVAFSLPFLIQYHFSIIKEKTIVKLYIILK